MNYIALFLIYYSGIYFALTYIFQISPDLGYGLANITLLRHGVYFGLGMLIWHAQINRLTLHEKLAIFAAILIASFEIRLRCAEISQNSAGYSTDTLFLEAGIVWITSVAVVAISPLLRSNVSSSAAKIVVKLGLMTYPLYMLHEAVGGATQTLAIRFGVQPVAGLAAAFFVSGLMALFVSLWAEPMAKGFLRRHIPALTGGRTELARTPR